MERISHCNICYKTFNEAANEPEGTLEPDIATSEVKLICKQCRTNRWRSQKALDQPEDNGQTLVDDHDNNSKASCGLTTVRSRLTSSKS